jgi:DNA-binding transcriptional regulator YdaS (Cro superfamily)
MNDISRSQVEGPFELAVDAIGGWAELGRRTGVSPQAAHKWKLKVPADKIKNVLRALEGRVTPHDVRPDLYPPGFEFPAEMLNEAQQAAS